MPAIVVQRPANSGGTGSRSSVPEVETVLVEVIAESITVVTGEQDVKSYLAQKED